MPLDYRQVGKFYAIWYLLPKKITSTIKKFEKAEWKWMAPSMG